MATHNKNATPTPARYLYSDFSSNLFGFITAKAFGIFAAFSYIKHISSLKQNMQNNKQDLDTLITTIEKKIEILEKILQDSTLSHIQKTKYQKYM